MLPVLKNANCACKKQGIGMHEKLKENLYERLKTGNFYARVLSIGLSEAKLENCRIGGDALMSTCSGNKAPERRKRGKCVNNNQRSDQYKLRAGSSRDMKTSFREQV